MRRINFLTIRTRLYLIILIVFISIIAITTQSVITTNEISKVINTINDHPLIVSNTAANSKIIVQELYNNYLEAFTVKIDTNKLLYEKKTESLEAQLKSNMATIKSLILGDEGQKLANKAEVDLDKFIVGNYGTFNKIYDLTLRESAREYLSVTKKAEIEGLMNKLDEIQKYAKSKAEELEKQAEAVRKDSIYLIIIISLGLVFLIFVFTFIIIRSILNSLRKLKETMAESLEEDKFLRAKMEGRDEIVEVANYYDNLIEKLKYQFELRKGLSDLSSSISGDLSLQEFADRTISFLSKYTNSGNGVFYVYSMEKECLDLIASFAFTKRQKLLNHVRIGESIIGQVAIERKPIILKNINRSEATINSGIISEAPTNIIAFPLEFEGQLCGVIELSSFEIFSDAIIDYLNKAAEIIAVSIYATIQGTKIHQLLDESRKTNEQLEEQKRILNEKNNTLMISQAEILKKAEALEKANKYKSEFLANMSHELRTPLNSILVLSQLLSVKKTDEPLSEKEKEFANTIHSSGEDLLTLINGILDLSKAEAGKLHIHNEAVYLKELLSDNNNMFESMADMKKLEYISQIEDNMPEYIMSDYLRINQILKNLISNAIKFTHKGQVKLVFRSITPEESENMKINSSDFIGIEVIDTGIGIAKEKQNDVFEAFKQSDGTTSRQYGGTGLGLTISLQLAKLLGGNIYLESEINNGSSFLLVLPKKPTDETPKSDLLSAIELINNFDSDQVLPKNTYANISPEKGYEKFADEKYEKKILIIEDDPNFSKVLADLALGKGYTPLNAYTGKEGILIAKSEELMGIILDIGLPDMDGMILANLLSEDETTQNIPIHVISGVDDIMEGKSIVGAPKSIIGFLKKPVDIKSIYKILSKIENSDIKGAKNLLIVGACGDEDFKKLSQLGHLHINKVLTEKEAIKELEKENYGCIILDIKLPDSSGIDFMTKLRKDLNIQTPIIIYTEEDIAAEELDGINRYTETIIIKSSKSKDRLVDEVSLFLYDVQKKHTAYKEYDNVTNDEKNSLNGINVLLADDDSRNVFSLMHLLELNGMVVTIARDGYEAVTKFEENSIDIILMDIMMPKMDGYEAIKSIRSNQKGRTVPIIALTAKAMSEDREKCIKAGANDYLTKPVEADRLLSMIKVWVS